MNIVYLYIMDKVIDNVYTFDPLVYSDSHGKKRVWQAFVRIIKNKKGFNKINWNMLEENQLPIKEGYFDGKDKLPANSYSQYWTTSGSVDGKITLYAPIYPEPKNVGKSNATTHFQQAIKEMTSIYNKKKEKCGLLEQEGPEKDFYYPMLAERSGKYTFPVYMQTKFNGIRCISFIKKGEVIMYTRGRVSLPNSETINRIREELKDMIPENYYFDGELYRHGTPLNDITGIARNSNSTVEIDYNVYDFFDTANPKLKFSERLKILNKILKEKNYVKKVETALVHDEKSLEEFYKDRLENNYEGAMIRKPNGIYKFSMQSNTRSKDIIKLKPNQDAEFEVVGFTQGNKGVDVGAVIWICRTESGREFNVRPKMSMEERKKVYEECLTDFDKLYSGRMLNVVFRELSPNGIPQEPRATGFRDIL